MASKSSIPIMRVPVSEEEFEILLRRASECAATGRPHLVTKVEPPKKAPRSAA